MTQEIRRRRRKRRSRTTRPWFRIRLPKPATVSRPDSCPRCSGRVRRVQRTTWSRVAAMFLPTRRYACSNATCNWQGTKFGRANTWVLVGISWSTVALAAWMAAMGSLYVVRHLSRETEPDEIVEGDN